MTNVEHSSKVSSEETQFEWEFPDFFSYSETETEVSCESDTFFFAKTSWFLRLHVNFHSEIVDLQIVNKGIITECAVEYKFGLKKMDGIVEEFHSRKVDFRGGEQFNCGISKTELKAREHEMTPKGGLTITCTLKRGTTFCYEPPILDETSSMKLIKLNTLSENFKALFADKDSCDVVLQVKDEEFTAHKTILMARSTVFAAMFKHDASERETGVINISDCDPGSFEEFLEFLYCGKLEDITFRSAFYLYKTADKYDVQELVSFCVEYMEQCLEDETWYDILKLADKYDETRLLDAVQEFFNVNIRRIVETSEWDSLMRNNYRLSNKLIKGLASKVKIEE